MSISFRYHMVALIAALISGVHMTAGGTDRPQLVMGIVVDQLQTDYLEYLRPLMGKGGFNRLLANGLYLQDLDFGVPATDAASATAQLYTGAWPSATGIPAANIYDRRTRRMVPVLKGDRGFSPGALRLSTITDEVVVDGQRFGKVYSIAADATLAILMGGHTPTSAAWLDPNSGQWQTSSYYTGQLPPPLAVRNVSRPLRARIDTMRWEPLLDIKSYPGLPPQKKYYPFGHIFRSKERDAYTRFAASPLGNREITDVAVQYLTELRPGHGKGSIDMLNIGYSLAPWTAARDGDYRLELTDAYLRLDRDLERLLNALDKEVGLDRCVIFLLSTGHFDNDARPGDAYRIPGGDLSTRRAAALLNSYLGARYGHAEYVDGIAGTSVFLNARAMEEAGRHTSPSESSPLLDARDFLSRMDGIASVATASDILSATTESLEEASRAIDIRTAGDLIISVQPGWTLVDDYSTPATRRAIRRSTVATPAIIHTPASKPEVMAAPVSALRIAPTICRMLRIPSPNGATARSLPVEH